MPEAVGKGYFFSERDDAPNELAVCIRQTDLSEIVIPSEIEGKTVTKLNLNSAEAPELRRLVIPATVKDFYFFPYITGSFKTFRAEVDPRNPWFTADEKAIFSKDKSRFILFTARQDKVYTLPEEVRVLGQYSFAGCDNQLEEIIFPEGTEQIEEYPFYDCCNIKKIVLSDSLRVIEENVFCCLESSNIDIQLPKNLEVIKDNAFLRVHGINEIYIRSNLKEIGGSVFPYKVNVFKIDEDNDHFTVKDGVLYSKDMKTVVCVSIGMGESIVIPDSVETIKDSAFSRLYELKEVKLPQQLSAIEYLAFEYCHALEKINLENVASIGSSAFCNTGLTSINVSCDFLEAFDYCHDLRSVTMKNTQIIGNSAFCDCDSLEEIILPEGLREIRTLAFSNTALKCVVIPKSVEVIEDNAFDVRYIEIYDTENSPVLGREGFSSRIGVEKDAEKAREWRKKAEAVG